ncbi:MAG: hypothetical protein DRP27_09200 [Thermotogae bacterium]|nr:MAG: hypothetical protein DRP27_09200 [Thermotogota bacterium]
MYKNMIQDYKTLYKKCMKGRTILAGVVEDSRGVGFCNLIKNTVLSRIRHPLKEEAVQLLSKTRDTNLLFWVLAKGEMSRVFRYSESPREHPVLKDFGPLSKSIYSFYLKTAELDRPVRVDCLGREHAKRAASILLAVSGHHPGYGLPAPLIEADNVSKLSEAEIETFHSFILACTGNIPSVMTLRREQRPF